MAEQKKTSGSLALKAAPRLVTIPAAEQPEARKIRVAAYCRVSSDSLDQLNSFAAQNAYYTALIGANPDWELVDIYADRGITGTSADKRDDFQRLLSDCRRGLIDKVLVKSVTRFARNTKDFLKATRELKAIGVGVCFEEQNIDSSMVSGEMLASIFASLAQKESESISQNMRMSYKRRMECGTYLPNSLPYGYRLVGREVEIDHEKAKIIHRIFQDYLAGISMRAIADRLNSEQPACVSRRQWSASSISYILTNEQEHGSPYSGEYQVHRWWRTPRRDSGGRFSQSAEAKEGSNRTHHKVAGAERTAAALRRNPPKYVEGQVLGILNRLIADPGSIQAPTAEPEDTAQAKILRQKLAGLLGEAPVDEDAARRTALALAAERLDAIGPEEHETERLRRVFRRTAPLKRLDVDLLHSSVRKITIQKHRAIVQLKNGQIVEGGPLK